MYFYRFLILIQTYNTTKLTTACGTNHCTAFGSAWFPEVNTIDFEFIFAHASFEDNMTIYLWLIITLIIYISFMIYAYIKDRRDVKAVSFSLSFAYATYLTFLMLIDIRRNIYLSLFLTGHRFPEKIIIRHFFSLVKACCSDSARQLPHRQILLRDHRRDRPAGEPRHHLKHLLHPLRRQGQHRGQVLLRPQQGNLQIRRHRCIPHGDRG